jgi:DNA-binding LacI/PurR family transcriptional regulator
MKTNNDLLYKKLKNILAEKIYRGEFSDGQLLPTERDLAAQYDMSRVTVRKALELMAAEGFVIRHQGRGSIYREKTSGYTGSMEIISLVAPANNPFFSSFISRFEKIAEENGSLVVFKPAHRDTPRQFEDTLLKLYLKDIRHLVIWPHGQPPDEAATRQLRGLGANIVFFDHVSASVPADCVSVDNADAIRSLYAYCKSSGAQEIGFIGWDRVSGYSTQVREDTFHTLAGNGNPIYRLPWREEQGVEADVSVWVDRNMAAGSRPDAFICGNGYIGIALKRIFNQRGMQNILVCCVDDFSGAEQLHLTVYDQPMQKMAQKVFSQLLAQNQKGKNWKAGAFLLKGNLIIRE